MEFLRLLIVLFPKPSIRTYSRVNDRWAAKDEKQYGIRKY